MGGTYTDMRVSYTNKQKDDLGCCPLQTEDALFSQLLTGTNEQEAQNP